jgi:sec-independent protein translocase protein TatA
MFDLGAGELVLIVFVVLILFGPKKLPELAQSLGRGMREFKRAQREFTEQINQAVNDDHYRKQRGPELERPEGSVARGGTRRLTPTEGSGEGAGDAPRDAGLPMSDAAPGNASPTGEASPTGNASPTGDDSPTNDEARGGDAPPATPPDSRL